MRCFFTFAIAAALAAGWNATTWSQTSGGAGASGAGGASGASGTASGTSGASSATGTGSPGASGNVGAGNTVPGASGNTAAGTVNGANSGGVAPNVATGTNGTTNRANATGINNRANGTGINNRASATGRFNLANANNSRANMDNNTGISQTPFFSDPGARQQLNMNNTQYNSLNRAYQNAYTRYNNAVNSLDPNLTPEQREMQLQQLQSQFNQNLSGTVSSTLTNPQAQSRFGQLNRQYNGFNAFNDPTVRRELNLSQDQIRQLRSLSANWRQQMQQFGRNGTNNQTATGPGQWARMQQQYSTQLNGVLTPQQQQLWSQLTGQAYAFPQNAYFGNQQSGAEIIDQKLNDELIRQQQVPAPAGSAATTQGGQDSTAIQQQQTPAPNTATPSTANQGGATQGTQGGTVR